MLVSTLQQDRKQNGAPVVGQGQIGALMARNIYVNAGTYGANIYGIRLVGVDAAAATVDCTNANADNQSITVTVLVAHSTNVARKISLLPVNVGKGDTFQVIIGQTGLTGTPITFSVVATEASPSNVTGLWYAAMQADTDFTEKFTVSLSGDALIVTSKTVNLTFTNVASTTNGSTTPISVFEAFAGRQGLDDPGDWANGTLAVKAYPYGAVVNGSYLLEVLYKGSVVESFTGKTILSMYQQINSTSEYIHIVEGTAGAWFTTTQTFTMSGGVYDAPANEAAYLPSYDTDGTPNGMAIFDGVNVQLIINADYHTNTIAVAGRDYCAGREDCMFVAALPQFATDTTVASYAAVIQTGDITGSYVASYNAWMQTSDENGGNVWVPAIGAILGAGYLKVPQMQNDRIWIAPAGTDSVLLDCVSVTPNKLSQTTIDLYVKTHSVNVVMFKQGYGNFVLTSRTMSTAAMYASVHTRRLANWLLATEKLSMLWVLQQPNTPELRNQIRVSQIQFFRTIYNDGGLEKSVPFEVACEVICDSRNNPPSAPRTSLYCDVNYIPVECVESFRLNLNRNDGVLSVTSASQDN
jgi:hypothetical protein